MEEVRGDDWGRTEKIVKPLAAVIGLTWPVQHGRENKKALGEPSFEKERCGGMEPLIKANRTLMRETPSIAELTVADRLCELKPGREVWGITSTALRRLPICSLTDAKAIGTMRG